MIEFDDREWFSWEGVVSIRQRCEAQAVSEGLAGLELFFRGQELFSQCLAARSSYRDRQAAWFKKQTASRDPFREVLQAIADGHNDPRSLAREVLKNDLA